MCSMSETVNPTDQEQFENKADEEDYEVTWMDIPAEPVDKRII